MTAEASAGVERVRSSSMTKRLLKDGSRAPNPWAFRVMKAQMSVRIERNPVVEN
jgi:hypothetical protein